VTRKAPEASRPSIANISCICFCACIAVLPLVLRGNSFGHDFDFHLLSWMETAKQWHEGVFYPHWLASANYGAGEPRFVFYPPASWMLGGLLGALTNWAIAPVAFLFVSLFLSGLSFYLLAKKWMPGRFACAAGCLYAVNPYAIFNAYERSAYSELLAGAWMPLLLLFALRRRSSIAPLAIAVAAIWLTNAPAGVMACYTLAALGGVLSIMRREAGPLIRMALGGIFGVGLSAFYLVPAAYERRWVEIARAIGPGMRVEDSFLFERGGEDFHAAVLRTASWIAVILLSIAAGALAVLWRRGRENVRPDGSQIGKICGAITVCVLLMLLPLSEIVWRFAPEMRFLQFPWRWLLVQSVATELLCGLALCSWLRAPLPRPRLLATALLVVVGLAVYAETSVFFQREDDDDTLASQLTNYRSGMGVEGTDEYTPLGADNSAIQKNLPAVRVLRRFNEDGAADAENATAGVTVERWQAEHKLFDVIASGSGFAVVRLMDYPAWHVTVNGSEPSSRPRRLDGLLAVPVPDGRSQIEISWKSTRDVTLGRFVTGISVLLLLPVGLMERRRTRVGQV
jgi:hypothetical protein